MEITARKKKRAPSGGPRPMIGRVSALNVTIDSKLAQSAARGYFASLRCRDPSFPRIRSARRLSLWIRIQVHDGRRARVEALLTRTGTPALERGYSRLKSAGPCSSI